MQSPPPPDIIVLLRRRSSSCSSSHNSSTRTPTRPMVLCYSIERILVSPCHGAAFSDLSRHPLDVYSIESCVYSLFLLYSPVESSPSRAKNGQHQRLPTRSTLTFNTWSSPASSLILGYFNIRLQLPLKFNHPIDWILFSSCFILWLWDKLVLITRFINNGWQCNRHWSV
jgi:hypothetical protein